MAIETPQKRVPSLAFLVSAISGIFWLWFGLAEMLSHTNTDKGIMEYLSDFSHVLVFAAPFLIAAWLLWVKPRAGSIVLILIGLSMATWMFLDWKITTWLVPSLLVVFPILLGIFNLFRVKVNKPA